MPATGPGPGLAWAHRFAALGTAFSTELAPTPLPGPAWVARDDRTAHRLGLDTAWWRSDGALQALAGNRAIAGARPVATVYSGHQFGQWAGQLGDGRAILLGETGTGLEIQLKGAGRTPYSRGGDGRAVLRSSIREYLASVAMRGLGLPTTDALCVVGSPQPVRREAVETAAVVTRVAPSFIRFGHFEHFAALDRLPELQRLADHVIDAHYPDCRDGACHPAAAGNPYAALLARVTERTAELLAGWQSVGFCHGVMNTDNMSVLGLAIDYGPFQFLDAFVPGHVCNHSDTQGRYAFNQQPNVAYWNLFCLGQALMPLIEDQALALAALEPFRTAFPRAFEARMAAKLGLVRSHAGDGALIDRTLALLAAAGIDYSIFWRRLAEHVAGAPPERLRDLAPDRAAFDAWLLSYSERIAHHPPAQAADLMLKTNPKFVLRNHLGETAIRAAQAGDFSIVGTLQKLLESPYDAHPGFDAEAGFPPDWASTIEISCSS